MKIIIIGGGQVGTYIANLLIQSNNTVKVIENRENVYAKLKNELPEETIVFGSGTDPNILEACGIGSADVVAAVSGADEVNLVASTIAKFEFDVPRVIARINNPKNNWLFNHSMGVDVALNQADLMAHLVVEEMDLKNMYTLLKLNRGNYSIIQITTDTRSASVGKAVKDLVIPQNVVLISIQRNSGMIIPRGDTVIAGGDHIIALADKDTQAEINRLFSAE